MKAAKYKDFYARFEFDVDDDVFVGRLVGIRDVVSFHADTVDGLKAAFVEAVDDYLDACKQENKAPERAYSGNMMLRVSPDLHAKAALAADLAGVSLNEWGERTLSKALDHDAA